MKNYFFVAIGSMKKNRAKMKFKTFVEFSWEN